MEFLRALAFSEWQMSTGFNLELPAALAPNRRGSLFFEALKPATDFSLAVNLADGLFFQQKAVCLHGRPVVYYSHLR